MRFLEAWMGSPFTGVLGWTLLHSLWEGIMISALLAAMLIVLRSSRARYHAACVAMVLLFFSFIVTLIWLMPESSHGLTSKKPIQFYPLDIQNGLDVMSSTNSGLAAVVPWFTPFWFAGVWFVYLGQIIGWISIDRLRRRGVCYPPQFWRQAIPRLSGRMYLSRPVQLLESCLVNMPIVIGHFRPVILVPLGLFAGLTPEQIEAVLLHELAHVRRCDYLVNMLQRLVEGLLFYNPAVWWISHLMRSERENCCDDLVVAAMSDAHEYAKALVILEQNRQPGLEQAVAVTGGNLVSRVHRVLYPQKPIGVWAPFLACLLLVSTAMVALAVWPTGSFQQSPSSLPVQPDRVKASPYAKWLNEEVVYIIADAERAAFQNLNTDEERDKFIEQFWLRRDPTPGTAENEFKTEHYRRIEYANARFRTQSGTPGWKTDRGHLYIIYGPPDQIESHPSGLPTSSSPFEVWMYRSLEGIGDNQYVKFIDQSGMGDYRLSPESLSMLKSYLGAAHTSGRPKALGGKPSE
jgi:GWxTD domain-containing protein